MRFAIKDKLFALGNDFSVTDEGGTNCYVVDGKALTARQETALLDLQGNELAVIKRKLAALMPTYLIERPNSPTVTLKRKGKLLKAEYVAAGAGDDLVLDGNLADHDYVVSRGGTTVATVSKKWVAIADTFGLETAEGEDPVLMVSLVVALALAMDAAEAQRRR